MGFGGYRRPRDSGFRMLRCVSTFGSALCYSRLFRFSGHACLGAPGWGFQGSRPVGYSAGVAFYRCLVGNMPQALVLLGPWSPADLQRNRTSVNLS